MTSPTRFQSACALLVLVCAASHADASWLRGSADPATCNHAGVADFERMLSNGGFPVPYYANGCLPDEFKDKCEPCMCLDGGINVQTKRCDWNAVPDGSGSNGCVEKSPLGEQCSRNWMCKSNFCWSDVAACIDPATYASM
jgi:hypothetical protein